MPIEITMPKLSDTMEEGTILRWLKRVGESVAKGEVLAEVETDKADMELEAEQSGTLSEIRVKEGAAASVGAVIAVLNDARTATAAPQRAATVAATPTGTLRTPPPSTKPATIPPPPATKSAKGTSVPPPPPAGAPPAPAATTWTPRREAGSVPATGRQSESKLRLAVAKQMSASKREVPHFYVTAEVDMSDAARLRAMLAADSIPERITFTHLIIRALALTLARHPRANASWSDGGIVFHDDINIGIAVAVEDGLVAPVLRGCQDLTLRQIARATTDLVSKAQAGRFSGDELTGGTFSLSNMGMLDIEEFSAVIIPPQAAILAVGSIKDRPVVRDGHLAVAKTMRATLSVDHRVLNGVEAGRFLEDLKSVLEKPVLLIMASE